MESTVLDKMKTNAFRRVCSFRVRSSAEDKAGERRGRMFLTPPCNRYASKGDISPTIASRCLQSVAEKADSQRPMSSDRKNVSPKLTNDRFGSLLQLRVFERELNSRRHIIQEMLINKQFSASGEAEVFDSIHGQTKEDSSSSRKNYERAISCPSYTDANAEETSFTTHQRSCSDSEVLEPFQLLTSFKREPPSYWLGCVFRFVPGTEKLEITLRQTGVLPGMLSKYRFSKLSTCLSLPDASSKTIVLVKSKSDLSFRPHVLYFGVKNKQAVREKGLVVRLYHHTKVFLKTCIAEWRIPLDRCTEESKTEWRKYVTQG